MSDSSSERSFPTSSRDIADTDPRWTDLRSQALMFEATREEVDWDHMEDVRECAAVIRRAQWEKKILGRIESAARERLADLLGKGGKVVDNSNFYRNTQAHDRKAVDRDAFWRWVGEDASNLYKADKVPITAFRKLARERFRGKGDDEEIERLVGVLEETLFERKPSGPHKLEIKPIGGKYTPQYASRMTPYRVSRKESKEDE